METTPDDM